MSAGPLPRSVSTASATSSASPTATPSGSDMFESSARVSMSWSRPSLTIRAASRRAASGSGSSAPSPTLTSSSSRDAPAATFFDMMLAAISGRL